MAKNSRALNKDIYYLGSLISNFKGKYKKNYETEMEMARRNTQGFPSKRTAQRYVQFYEKMKDYKVFIYSSVSVSFLLNNIERFAKVLEANEELSNFFRTYADTIEEQLVVEEEEQARIETVRVASQAVQSSFNYTTT